MLILDGGMSRELIRLEAPFKQPEWSALALIESPHFVRQVHGDFATAGADILTTNSYALVPFHIGEDRFWNQGRELAALSGKLAREVADESANAKNGVRVAGSLPPIFGSYEPERFEPERVQGFLEVLVGGLSPYVDVWLGETLSLIAEAEAVMTGVASTGKPVWIAFTLDDKGDVFAPGREPCLRSGELVKDAARWAVDAGVEALLFNCSKPEFMATAVEVAQNVCKEESSKLKGTAPAIGVYANAFVEKSEGQKANSGISGTREDLTGETYLEFAREWAAKGASIVGGCCGIGAEHIGKVAQVLKRDTAEGKTSS